MGASQKRKEARRQKFGTTASEGPTEGSAATDISLNTGDPASDGYDSESVDEGERGVQVSNTDVNANDDSKNAPAADVDKPKAQRFIVFIGNLPFTTTEGELEQHFAKIKPKSIRHRVDTQSTKSKGFAFLEFDNFDRMKTCLKLYHHSMLESAGSTPRRINVELTAGGGGKGRDRKAKLREKNNRLSEQRKNAAKTAEEQNARAHDGNDGNTKHAVKRSRKPPNAASEPQPAMPPYAVGDEDVHPSRKQYFNQS